MHPDKFLRIGPADMCRWMSVCVCLQCRRVKAWSSCDVIFAYDVDSNKGSSCSTDHVTEHVASPAADSA